MQHSDPETLALAALGERVPDEDTEHLASCDQCAAELAELAALVTVGREAPEDLGAVPAGVWEGIRGELGLGRDTPTDPPVRIPSPVPSPAPSPGVPEQPGVIRMDASAARRRPGWLRTAAVAAVAACAGALLGGTLVWSAVEHADRSTSQETIVAQAVLDPLSPSVARPGKAQVLETPDGLVVRVDARSLPPSSGFHEVWLLDSHATKLVSLGALPSGSVGTFTVPPGVDISQFPVVDISLEPYDGNPEHSHDSLMRGTLAA